MLVNNRNFSVYLTSAQIAERIRQIADQINTDYAGKEIIFISVLNGSFLFTADLVRLVNNSCKVTFIKVASYEGMESTGRITELVGLSENIEGKDVIIAEDIIDTGYTMSYILDMLGKHRPASLKIATLLLKREALKVNIAPDYTGFEITNRFVVGYGLDYDGYGRNLPHIYQAV